jgi:hypothetical protein
MRKFVPNFKMDRSSNDGPQTGVWARERVYVPLPRAPSGDAVPLCRSVLQLVLVRG